VIQALQRAFAVEHGLQCGFCTPGMLMTARDIVMRLPDADEARVRVELSGNLCRCTGYAGIVRAVCRVLAERRGSANGPMAVSDTPILGPVGARKAADSAVATAVAHVASVTETAATDMMGDKADVGLGSRQANLETTISFTVARPVDELWMALEDVERVARCMPGASLTEATVDGRLKGRMAVKFGPIATNFSGSGLITRDDARRRGILYGVGRDRFTGSSVRAEVIYALHPDGESGARVDLTVRALLAGPLAQFGRSGIVQDLVARLAEDFARRLEHNLATGEDFAGGEASLSAGSLIFATLSGRVRALFDRLLFRRRS
jgi:aerobic carbon-monoxide dehydrogenase small subunit